MRVAKDVEHCKEVGCFPAEKHSSNSLVFSEIIETERQANAILLLYIRFSKISEKDGQIGRHNNFQKSFVIVIGYVWSSGDMSPYEYEREKI